MTQHTQNKYAHALKLAARHNVTIQDVFLLGAIDSHGEEGAKISTISESVGISSAALTGRIDKLETLNLAHRRRLVSDRRVIYISLKRDGYTLLSKLNTTLEL